jgi:putative transposase
MIHFFDFSVAIKLRASAAGVSEHVIHRGNNRQVVFGNEDDMKAYVTWLK